MRINPDNSPEKRAIYKAKLEAMPDGDLYTEAKRVIWLSAFANNNPQSCFHWQVDATYDEAQRRGKRKIYTDAYRYTFEAETGRDPHPEDGPIVDWEALDAAG